MAVRRRRGAAPVRRHLHGHLLRHGGALHAAAGPAGDPHADPAADPLRWRDAAREHARAGAEHHAGGADNAFRRTGAGDPFPQRRPVHRLATAARAGRDRHGVLSWRAIATTGVVALAATLPSIRPRRQANRSSPELYGITPASCVYVGNHTVTQRPEALGNFCISGRSIVPTC
ncbi:hypothetical protein PXNS11_350017 [Stutzerimonas xanthomarina]|nr:hypothetical protein PXNS11_350017 [Stutzerimonas xanthomarina]